MEWLSLQNDNGELYYNLYDTIINRKELLSVDNDKLNLDEKINKFINDILTDDQVKLWERCLAFIEKYVQIKKFKKYKSL